MSTVSLAEDLITFDEFCALIPDGQKADLIAGAIYVASPDSRRANELSSFLDALLRMYVCAKKLGGEVYVARFAFQLSEIDAPEPDVAYVRRQRLHLVERGRMNGGPDVAVEVVTRDSQRRDYIDKRKQYEAAGVAEYWIIDSVKRKTQFLRLGDDGRYEVVRLESKRIFRSRAVAGFWLDVRWLTAQRVPDAYDCLQELLRS
jgi:Uma2 family endonuclease